MSGGPYGPRGVLSDFEGGGGGGSPRCIIGQTPCLILVISSAIPGAENSFLVLIFNRFYFLEIRVI